MFEDYCWTPQKAYSMFSDDIVNVLCLCANPLEAMDSRETVKALALVLYKT